MSEPILDVAFRSALQEIDRSASAVLARGYDDDQLEWDDYATLLQTYEFRKLVTFELYEAYFPPRRHEFELDLLARLVDAVAASKPAAFLAGAAAGGVVGNAVYDMLKWSLAHVKERFRSARRTHDAVEAIVDNVDRVRAYMNAHDDVSAAKISADLDVEVCRIEPILKLLGCRAHRVKGRRLWRKSA